MIAVIERKHDIEQHKLRARLGKFGAHAPKIAHGYHLIAPALELPRDSLGKCMVILCEKYSIHGFLPFLCS